jgi:outer membrane protein OmpA-like peptidoglycan-associated protein
MSVKQRLLLLVIPAVLWAGHAAAGGSVTPTLPGGAVLQAYPGARLTAVSEPQRSRYPVLVGAREASGLPGAAMFTGRSRAAVYRVPAGVSAHTLFERFRDSLRGAGFAIELTCALGRCPRGTLDYWAMQANRTARWNGFDVEAVARRGFYGMITALRDGDTAVTVVIAGDRNGNGAEVVVDAIEPAVAPGSGPILSPGEAARRIRQNGRITLEELAFESGGARLRPRDDAHLKPLATYLRRRQVDRFHVVGHVVSRPPDRRDPEWQACRAEAVVQRLRHRFDIAADRLNPVCLPGGASASIPEAAMPEPGTDIVLIRRLE